MVPICFDQEKINTAFLLVNSSKVTSFWQEIRSHTLCQPIGMQYLFSPDQNK